MPADFQKAIDKTLYNLKNTFRFLDDIIIVTGGGLENHKKHLFNCLDRLNNENLAINLDKCRFAKSKITWLGHEITEKGMKPVISKTQAIINLKPPTTQKQLKSFLGSVHHLTKFIHKLATLCQGYRDLLQKDTKYVWTENHQPDFKTKNNIKNLTENNHYDIKRNTRVKTDASRSGLGAVLEQETCERMGDNIIRITIPKQSIRKIQYQRARITRCRMGTRTFQTLFTGTPLYSTNRPPSTLIHTQRTN